MFEYAIPKSHDSYVFVPLEQQKNTLRYPPCSDKPKSIIHMVNSPFWLLKSYWIILNPNLSPIWTNSHIHIDIIDLNVTDYTHLCSEVTIIDPNIIHPKVWTLYPTKLQIRFRVSPIHCPQNAIRTCLPTQIFAVSKSVSYFCNSSAKRCTWRVQGGANPVGGEKGGKTMGKPMEKGWGKPVSRHISWKWRKHPGKLMEMTDDVGFCCTLYVL